MGTQLASLDDANNDLAETRHAVLENLRDLPRRAEQLELHLFATVASELIALVETEPLVLTMPARRHQLASWLSRLSGHSATDVGDLEQHRALRALRDELADLRPSDRNRLPTGDAAIGAPRRQVRVLLFDDSPLVHAVLQEHLEVEGHAVAIATTLTEFYRQLRQFGPQLVILDVNMPEMAGDDVCRRLRKRAQTEKLPIVLLSSMQRPKLAQLAGDAGANGYISKSEGIDRLVQYLDTLLTELIPE